MKTTNKIFITCLLFLIAMKINAQNIWLDYGVEYEFKNKFKAGVDFEHRYLNGMMNYMNATTLNLSFRLSPVIKVAGSYRYAEYKDLNEWEDVEYENKQRFCIDLNSKFDIAENIEFKNRARYQTSLEEREDIKRYFRDKITLEVNIDNATDFTIANEVFVCINNEKPVVNRVTIGLHRQIANRIYIEPFFHVEIYKKWGTLQRDYVMGTGLYYRL